MKIELEQSDIKDIISRIDYKFLMEVKQEVKGYIRSYLTREEIRVLVKEEVRSQLRGKEDKK